MKYPVKALVVYLSAMAVCVAINETSALQFDTLHISLLGLFMFGSSVLVHYFTIKASEESPRRFPTYFMAITGLKMLAYLFALGAYVFIFRNAALPVVIGFLILYVVYTVLEVASAMKSLRSKS